MALCASAKQPFVFAAFRRREAAEALKAQDILAQGKHTESVRRPGWRAVYVRVPRPLWAQSAKLTAPKGAMEAAFRVYYVARLQRAISGGMLTQGCATGATLG